MALPIESICRSPPLRLDALTRAAHAKRRKQLVRLLDGDALIRAVATPEAAETEILIDGQLADDAVPLGHVTHTQDARSPRESARRAAGRRACTEPARGFTRPEMVRTSVVLPAPLAPSTAVMLPSGTDSDTRSSAIDPAIRDGEIA